MKKKIKDLTLEEMLKVCISNKECNNCSLFEPHCRKCISQTLYSFKKNKTFLEREVEIDG